MRPFHSLLLLSSLFCLQLGGQPTPADGEPIIQTKLTGIALGSPIRELYLFDGQDYQQVNFYPGSRSASVRYTGPETIRLYEKRENPETGVSYAPIASAQLKTGVSDHLLFLSRTSSRTPVQMLAIPEDLSDFKVGSFRFINLTEKSLAIKLGEARSLLKPQNYCDIADDFDSGSSYQTMIVELPKGDDQAPQRLFHSSLYFNENARMLYLISDRERGGIQLTGVPQVYQSGD